MASESHESHSVDCDLAPAVLAQSQLPHFTIHKDRHRHSQCNGFHGEMSNAMAFSEIIDF
jgi:hypothetical protein